MDNNILNRNMNIVNDEQQQGDEDHDDEDEEAQASSFYSNFLADSNSADPDSNHPSSSAHAPQAASFSSSSNPGRYFHFGINKAGMGNVDREKVNQIIHEASKGSKYYEKAKRSDEKLQMKISLLKTRAESLTQTEIQFGHIQVEEKVKMLEQSRDLTRTWCVVDFDAFYAACEERDFPHLKGKAVAIGLRLISTANYEARKFGVRSAMPEFIARKLCPHLIVRPLRFAAYSAVAQIARHVYEKYDVNFTSFSQDEAYLDISEYLRNNPALTPEQAVSQLRQDLFSATNLTVSAGIASTPMLAKICADINKPNGQYYIAQNRQAVLEFLSDLAIRRVPGIGKQTEELLKGVFGVLYVKDLWTRRVAINRVLSELESDFLLRVCLGVTDNNSVHAPFAVRHDRKSIGTERTFHALSDNEAMWKKLKEICCTLAGEIANENLYGRTLTLKLKTSDFDVRSRSVSLNNLIGGPSITGEVLLELVKPLMTAELPCSNSPFCLMCSKLLTSSRLVLFAKCM